MKNDHSSVRETISGILTVASLFASTWLLITLVNMRNEISPLIQQAVQNRDKTRYEKIETNQDGKYYRSNYVIAFGELYKKEFIKAGKKYRLPPELILAVFYPEFCAQSALSKFRDDVLTHVPYWNPSIGLGQVRIETGITLAELFGRNMTREEVVTALNTPEGAIEFVAMYLRKTIDDKKMGSAHEIVVKPERLIELYGYYVGGQTPVEDARLVGLALLHPFTQAAFYEVLGTYSMEERICIATKAAEFADLNKPSSVQKLEETTKRFKTENRGEYYCKTAQDRPKATEIRERTEEYRKFLDTLRKRNQKEQRMRPTSLIRREHRRTHC